MQSEERELIEGLFSRLKQAESQTGPRDTAAEQLIKLRLQEQPGAPYYMAQAILIQEAALKKLNERVAQLEGQLTQMQHQPRQNSSGFLSGLFGGGSRQQSPVWNNTPASPQQAPAYHPAATPTRGSGFLGGALQTAVGVAGGVVMADMLTSLFHHSQPEEIVNIINDTPLPEVDNSLDTFNGTDQHSFLNQDAGWDNNSFASNNDLNDFDQQDDFDDNNFV